MQFYKYLIASKKIILRRMAPSAVFQIWIGYKCQLQYNDKTLIK
jgi:hypothetical protein